MGRIVDFLVKKTEKRSSLLNDENHWINLIAQKYGTSAGIGVTADLALSTSAVFACVRVIAETIASLPLIVYRREGESKIAVPQHPLYPLIHDIGPNPWQTAPEFWEMMLGHNALRGNAFAYIVRENSGKIRNLVPLNPAKMEVRFEMADIASPKIVYKYKPDAALSVDIPAENIWHLKGISSDGVMGMSPLQYGKEAFGLSLAAETHGSVYFKNGAKPSGVVSYPGKLKEDSYRRFKESVQDAVAGDNKFKVLLMEEGGTWAQVGMSNEDSQFLETRQFQVEDIARIFRVPAILIGHPDKTSTYKSAEQFMISFVTHTIRPWLVRVEKSILKNLFSPDEQQKYFAEFKVDGLLRGDTKSRYDAYATAIQNTFMSPNEARAFENLPPREGGDVYENPNVKTKEDKNDDAQKQD